MREGLCSIKFMNYLDALDTLDTLLIYLESVADAAGHHVPERLPKTMINTHQHASMIMKLV